MERIEGDRWEQARAICKAQADDLGAGRTRRIQSEGLTIADLASHFFIQTNFGSSSRCAT
jgi:hypothetical protein